METIYPFTAGNMEDIVLPKAKLEELCKQVLNDHQKFIHRAKPKQLGMLETILLRVAGKRDGKSEIGMFEKKGSNSTPFVQKEYDTFTRFSYQAWYETKKRCSPLLYAEGILQNELSRWESQYQTLLSNPPKLPTEDALVTPKRGEENLDLDIIQRRRQQEYFGTYNVKVQKLENKIEDLQSRRDIVYSALNEAVGLTKLFCKQAQSRTQQRVDTYWIGLMSTHPQCDALPSAPRVLSDNTHEKCFCNKYITPTGLKED